MRNQYECVCCGEVCEDAASLRHHEREQHGGRERERQRRRRALTSK